uniref:TSC22 domain family, member 4 n=1 Tax=Amphiprion ocellaris TaxID=80972 RepID=A0AAQ5ZUR4_AMPOC
MSGGKKRSGFQITSVTSDLHQSPAGQSSPSMVLSVLQSDTSSSCSPQGSSSQPTTPSLKRKYVSHDAAGQGAGSSSRFRVVRLAVGGAGGGGRGESYRRGRWTCMEFLERQERAGFRRVMDSMRHAHSLESLEMIGRDRDRGGVHSQDTAHLLVQPMRGVEGAVIPDHLSVCLSLICLSLICLSVCLSVSDLSVSLSCSSSSNSLIAIDNKIEQAMDLVKSHLMLAVREEVELLREQIRDLQEKNQQLERENHILRALTTNGP